MARKLKDVLIEEITICDEPANRKKFYILKQRRLNMEELLENLKKILGDETVDESSVAKIKALPEEKIEEIRKALEEVDGYQENFPPALNEAFLSLVKSATYEYPEKESALDFEDVEKAGASLSKATIAQLKKIQEIIEKLIGEKTKKFIDKDGNKLELPEDVLRQLEELDELKKADKERVKKEKEDTEKKEKEDIKTLKEDVEKLKKAKGIKKSIEGQDNDADDGDEEDPFPSIPVVR